MKLQFKHQKFQADAAKAVVDVFAGQPYLTPTYMMDRGTGIFQIGMNEEDDFTGWRNQPLVPELSKRMILEQIQEIQRIYQITPSQKLEGEGYNLTIEMETGVGKTYTYIKTMFELNKHYGWSKFIVVVPSIAIREGVYKSFEVTQEHFAEEYGKKIRFFIYNSAQLTEIDRFASDNSINVMIINSQAFNARGKDARRIYMKLDEFRSRRPIDIIAKTNPVLIIDEPQSVEGKQTKERLREFHPLLTLRYSATHKSDSIYNMIYRLDAMEAYNKRLVKKIAVKGIAESGSTATESYVYLQSINLSKADPTATIQFDYKGTSGIRKVTKTVSIGFNLYDQSNGMEEYHNNFVVKSIDGRDDSVEFLNGIKIYAGDVIGKVSEEQLRRIQIRETILSHIERERQLYYKGIKVLSLFFIDEVAHYKQYDETGESKNGIFADMFEEEYRDIVENLQMGIGEEAYFHYLNSISAESTHAGYFSIDKKGKMVNSKVGRRETTTDDVDAYDLIMKNKELLLDRDPKRSPVRFIFSHSALREGWDNPNVFQICTLKQSGSDVRKRQEVGRGLRLCVNQDGERQDANVLGNDVHNINILTVIASESYDSFAKGLQSEIAEAVADRPRAITVDLFVGKVIKDSSGHEQVIDKDIADAIMYDLIINRYIDKKGALTDKYYEEKANGTLQVAYAFRILRQKNYDEIAAEEFDDIQDLFAVILAKGVSQQLKQGLHKEYITKNEGLSVMRGKLDIYGTIKNQIQRKKSLSCEYDELSVNNIFNQILKTTMTILIRDSGVKKSHKADLKKIILFFHDIDIIEPSRIRWSSLMYQRNNKNYEMLINICYFVLDGMLQTTDKGNYKMMTFSDEHMHRLYEKFVLEYFKRHHSYLSEVRAAQVKWNLATDTEESMIRFLPAMQTDIFLRYKEKVLIIDTKYYGNSMQKQYDKVTIHSGNMYQIFTYVKNQDVENNGRVSGMLLYAKTEEAITPDCSFVIGGNKISVKTVDLNKEFKLIAAQLDKIAEDYFGKKRIEDSII